MAKKRNTESLLKELRQALPEDLAREAESSGLLTPEALESLLRSELSRRHRISRLFDAADQLAGRASEPLTEAELEAEIVAARSARQNPDARSR